MNQKIESVLSITLTLAGVMMAGAVTYKQFAQPGPLELAAYGAPERFEGWDDLISAGGTRIGSPLAPVQIIEFGDFECPFCRRLHQDLESLLEEHPKEVSLLYFHLPLKNIHRFAELAAKTAECGHEQGLFKETGSALFAQQDSFGLKSWVSIAADAGVADTVRFSECLASDDVRDGIDNDVAVASGLSIHATPTVFINGWRLGYPPPADSLRRMVNDVIAGKDVFPND